MNSTVNVTDYLTVFRPAVRAIKAAKSAKRKDQAVKRAAVNLGLWS